MTEHKTDDLNLENNPIPPPECFTLKPEHIKYIEDNLDWVRSTIGDIRYTSVGLTFDKVLPVGFHSVDTVIVVKKPRHGAIEKVIRDIKIADQNSINHGLIEIAPSYRVGEFIVQKGLIDDHNLTYEEIKRQKDGFLEKIRSLGGFLDSADDNIFITSNGPCAPDTLSLHWDT